MATDARVVGFGNDARHERTRGKGKKLLFAKEALTFRLEDPDTPVCYEIDEVFERGVIVAVGVVRQRVKEGRDGFA